MRGCNRIEKRTQIDDILYNNSVDIAFLQETKLHSGKANTTHYNWHLSGEVENNKTQRGTAVLISKFLEPHMFRISEINESITTLQYKVNEDQIQLIIVYMPDDKRGPEEFNKLVIHMLTQKRQVNTLILGDFNAHIGYKDITAGDKNE